MGILVALYNEANPTDEFGTTIAWDCEEEESEFGTTIKW